MKPVYKTIQLIKVESQYELKDIINGDIINVTGDVNLYYKKLTTIPAKFGKVSGDFYCHYNQLTSFEGCPTEVGGSFSCGNNHLTSLVRYS